MIKHWEPLRKETISKLNVLADTIDEVCKTMTSEKKIIPQLPIRETQKHMSADHSATIRVVNIISGIGVVIEEIAELTPENESMKLHKILLSTSPNAIAFIADKLGELSLDVAELSESLGEQGKDIEGYGENIKKLGKLAVTMGGVVGWIPTKKAGKEVGAIGGKLSWIGDLIQDGSKAVANVIADVSGAAKTIAGSFCSTPDNNTISITLFPINIMKRLHGNLAMVKGSTETNAAKELREMAQTHEIQMNVILETVD